MNWSPFSDWCHEPCPGGQQEDDLDLSEIPGSCVSADGTTQAQGTLTPPGLGAQGLSRDSEAKPPHDVINVWKGLGEEEKQNILIWVIPRGGSELSEQIHIWCVTLMSGTNPADAGWCYRTHFCQAEMELLTVFCALHSPGRQGWSLIWQWSVWERN